MNRKTGKVSLERALSKMGIASRTQAHQMVLEGKVKVDGKLTKNPLHQVSPEKTKIEINNQQVYKSEFALYILNKPKGYVTTKSDEKGRPTVYELLPKELQNLHAIGRLDMATAGLLLFTNSTKFSNWITNPENNISRVYQVIVRGLLSQEVANRAQKGVVDHDEILIAQKVLIQKSSNRETHLRVHLTEGKNREIRRMFKALQHEVTQLKRISFGGIELKDLELAKLINVSATEVQKIFPKAPLK